MTLDRAIEIFIKRNEKSFSEYERLFHERLENIQFLADTSVTENFKEIYLIQISNLKKAFQVIGQKKSELSSISFPITFYKDLIKSTDIQLLEREANEAFLDSRVAFSKELYKRIMQLNMRHNRASERIEICNLVLSEYRKAEEERDRLKVLKEKNAALQQEHLRKEAAEELWLRDILKADDQADGELSGLVKSLFLSGKGLKRLPTSSRIRKKKKEAAIFGSAVLLFVMGVMLYAYNEKIIETLRTYKNPVDEKGKPTFTVEDHKVFADELYEEGNYVKALIQYSLAAAIDPNDKYLQEQIAVCKLVIQQDRKSIPAAYAAQEETVEEQVDDSALSTDSTSSNNSNNSALENNTANPELAGVQNVTESLKRPLNKKLIADEDLIPDKIESTEDLDSLLATDDSSFVAMIADSSDVPEVNSLAKKGGNLALNVDDKNVKERILQKANERIQEDQEFLSKIYMVVDKRPEPKGGFDNFKEYLRRNMQYPDKAVKNKIEGVVYVQFVVNRDGSISAAKTTTNLGYGLEEEAIRLVNEYPGWQPGQINSRNVNVQTSLPIWFVQQ
ncbi:energy transducer TonB [Chondrinema litorale]|uniref:energy transducer TonB n=1 Tax=Chondrinema litorale TaxID=2994555 RepID=UPI0025433AFF|nr:energy transducer TonB [Chondrinema litorale]UZR93567.1 energy transducer TonB [Chondrinema litorale]